MGQTIRELGWEILLHEVCLPDLSTLDYHFFQIFGNKVKTSKDSSKNSFVMEYTTAKSWNMATESQGKYFHD